VDSVKSNSEKRLELSLIIISLEFL